MQYIKQEKNKSRSHVTEWEWRGDVSSRSYRQLLAAGSVIIYEMV